MPTTLDKIKRLEQIVTINHSSDIVIDVTIDKIFKREMAKLKNKIQDLKNQILLFEKKYNLDSGRLKTDYEKGLLGDNIDFVEWTATLEMISNTEQQFSILKGK